MGKRRRERQRKADKREAFLAREKVNSGFHWIQSVSE